MITVMKRVNVKLPLTHVIGWSLRNGIMTYLVNRQTHHIDSHTFNNKGLVFKEDKKCVYLFGSSGFGLITELLKKNLNQNDVKLIVVNSQ